jgi:lipopolysaccharide assembly outer membrane protein LptD (OstA)
MKRLALIACIGVLAFAQPAIRHDDIRVTADRVENDGHVRHLSGNVVIETDAMVLRASEADYNDDATEITARGDVHVKFK